MKTIISTFFKINFIICVLLSANIAVAQIESTLAGGNWNDNTTWIGNQIPGPTDNVIIHGSVVLDISPTCNHITIQATGTISNISSGSRTLTVNGNLTNHGSLVDNYYNLTLDIHGDIYNDGNWLNEYTNLEGSSDQDIWSSTPFSGANFNSSNAPKNINITSDDIVFTGCKVDLGDANMVFGNGSLSVFGFYFQDAIITADQLDVTVTAGGYLDDIIFNTNYTSLSGVVYVMTGVEFNDNTENVVVEVIDTLMNSSNTSHIITINGDLHNNGLIQDNYYNLTVNVAGSIVNNGTWTNYFTNLTGDGNQHLTFNEEFAGENFDSYMTGNGVATGTNALRFNGTDIDFHGDTLFMNAGYDSIFVHGGYLHDITVIAGASPWQVYCHQSNNAYFDDVIIESDDAVLDGDFQFMTSFEVIGQARVEGILQNLSNTSHSATITGNLINNGTIQDNLYSNYLYISGDITNNGTWTNYHTYLTGGADQNLTFTQEFGGEYLTNSNIDGKVISHSTLDFNSTVIDFNYDTLVFAGGADSLLLSGDYFQEVVIIKDGSKTSGFLHCANTNSAYFHDAIIVGENIDLGRVFQFTSPMSFYGHVTVNDTLQNYTNSSYTAYIYGNLSNNGTIQNNYYSNYLYITGDVFQNGIWTNNHTYLSGGTDQNLWFTETFSGTYLTNSNNDGKVISNSTLSFSNTVIDFNYDTLMFAAGADSLIMDDEYLQEVVIIKEGSKTAGLLNIVHNNNAYFHDVDIVADNVDLNGIFQYSDPVSIYGNVTVSGIMQNRPIGNYTAYIYGDVTNNGTIQNDYYINTLYITGNISQNGIWSNYYTYLSGTTTQTINQTNPFTGYQIVDTNPISAVQATSDLDFQNTDVDLGGATLMMPEGMMISVTDAWFDNANVVSNAFAFAMHGNSYLESTSLENATLIDWVKVRPGCTFSGKTTVKDTLSNYSNGNVTLSINGDIVNNGSIQSHVYSLTLEIGGHSVNNGNWTNYRTIINGSSDQSIYLLNDQEITGQVYFDALSAGTPYQWYYEGGILNSPAFIGETSNSLIWGVPVSPTWYGDFYCQTGAGQSRTITVEGGLIFDLAVMLEGSFNGSGMNTTLNSNGQIPLSQPYNVAPWNYSGTETVVSIPSDVVDWILLEFRETAGGPEMATPGTMITQRAFFLRNDGTIVNLDGTADIRFNAPTVTENLYLVVYHRNHLGVLSANPISFDIAPLNYDFTSGASQAYGGTLGHKDLGSGIYGMMGGDANSDGDVDGADFLLWQNNAGSAAVYDRIDINMDNQVDNLDKNDIWVGNNTGSSQVPE